MKWVSSRQFRHHPYWTRRNPKRACAWIEFPAPYYQKRNRRYLENVRLTPSLTLNSRIDPGTGGSSLHRSWNLGVVHINNVPAGHVFMSAWRYKGELPVWRHGSSFLVNLIIKTFYNSLKALHISGSLHSRFGHLNQKSAWVTAMDSFFLLVPARAFNHKGHRNISPLLSDSPYIQSTAALKCWSAPDFRLYRVWILSRCYQYPSCTYMTSKPDTIMAGKTSQNRWSAMIPGSLSSP